MGVLRFALLALTDEPLKTKKRHEFRVAATGLSCQLGLLGRAAQMGLRKRQVFVSPSSGGWTISSGIRLPAESALDEGLLPGLSSAAILLRPHMAFPWCILERERAPRCLFLFL